MSNKLILRSLIVLLMAVVLLGVVAPAVAEVNATKAFYVWDDNALQYKNSISDLFLDGSETHVIHEIGFDNDLYDPTVAGKPLKEMCDKVAALQGLPANDPNFGTWREDCPLATDHPTKFAGVMELGIPHIDNTNGAYAFAYSDDWSLIDCDINTDGGFTNGDLSFNTLLTPPLSPNDPTYVAGDDPILLPYWDVQSGYPPNLNQAFNFKILAIDVKTACTSGNCLEELVTTIFFDLDTTNDEALTTADGVPVDATGGEESGRTCFFARVYPIHSSFTDINNPPVVGLDPRTFNGGYPNVWTGNPQARITAGGGAKTVNFNVFGPTAITLEQLIAQSPGGVNPVVWAAIFVLLTAIAFVLLRESRQQVFLRKDE